MRSLACSSAPSIWAADPPNLSSGSLTVTMPPVRKAIFPAAGLGTRFLPVTKAQPKEMLPLVDKPTIQYGVEEAIASGIEQVIMVTGGGKRAIVDHFDRSLELEHYLSERGKSDLLHILSEVDELSNRVDITYIQQKEPLGLGHAVWTARRLVEGEPCAVLLADDVILGEAEPCLKQLIDAHLKTGATVLAVRRFPRSQVGRYGVVAIERSEGRLHTVTDMVEKPEPGTEPSDLAIIGRYVLTPAVFVELNRSEPGTGQEIQLTDAVKRTLGTHPVVALEFEGDYYDTGTVPGYLRANLMLAMKREGLREELAPLLRELLEGA
jgi:UTP--glucose-1-phosphate uridylyltransferase